MAIKPMTDEERRDSTNRRPDGLEASLDRALKNAEENTPFDEYGNYGENNPPLPMSKAGDKEYDS